MGKFVSAQRRQDLQRSALMCNRSADYMQGTRLSFRTKEDAIHFAEKQGVSCLVRLCC